VLLADVVVASLQKSPVMAALYFLCIVLLLVSAGKNVCNGELTICNELNYTVSQKRCHPNHGYNFVNYSSSICKILSLLQRAVNFQQNSY